jgi:hypothetical protein
VFHGIISDFGFRISDLKSAIANPQSEMFIVDRKQKT